MINFDLRFISQLPPHYLMLFGWLMCWLNYQRGKSKQSKTLWHGNMFCDLPWYLSLRKTLPPKGLLDVLHHERQQVEGGVVWNVCTSLDSCVFTLCNDILIGTSDIAMFQKGWAGCHKIYTIFWFLLGFIAANEHQPIDNWMSSQTGSKIIMVHY